MDVGLPDEVGDALSGPLADDTVIDGIIRLSLCVVWVAVAVILVTTVVEVVHAVRHHGLAFPDVRGVGWAQPIARYIAVGLVAVLPMMTSATSLASTLGARAAPAAAFAEPVGAVEATAVTATSDVAAARAPSAPSPAGGAVHVVAAGESIYSIAVSLAGGDSARVLEIADAIIDANLGTVMPGGQRFTNPAYVEVGWTLQLPTEMAGSRPAQSDTEHEVDTRGKDASVATYTVERGDTLWDIADEQLGDPTAWPEIWERNAGDDMGGGRTFDDPNLILPGWELELADRAGQARRCVSRVDGRGRPAGSHGCLRDRSSGADDGRPHRSRPHRRPRSTTHPMTRSPRVRSRSPPPRPRRLLPRRPRQPPRSRRPPTPRAIPPRTDPRTRRRPTLRLRSGSNMPPCWPPVCWRSSGCGAVGACVQPCRVIGCRSHVRTSRAPNAPCARSMPASGSCAPTSRVGRQLGR